MEAEITKAARLIAQSRRVVVFSGAGISAESGIGTFRGKGGFWNGLLGPLVLAFFGTPVGWNYTPRLAWSKYVSDFYNPIAEAEPNPGHVAISQLGTLLPVKVITQNVDGLHQRAGSPEEDVMEVHGTVRRYKCTKHGHPYEFESADPGEALKLPPSSPTCKVEGCGSYIRPDCVLFTEGLPMTTWMRSEEAVKALRAGDVMIIVGTSSVVQPAASLPEMAAKRGAHILEVNLEETPFSSLERHLLLKGPSGKVLPALVEETKNLLDQSKQ